MREKPVSDRKQAPTTAQESTRTEKTVPEPALTSKRSAVVIEESDDEADYPVNRTGLGPNDPLLMTIDEYNEWKESREKPKVKKRKANGRQRQCRRAHQNPPHREADSEQAHSPPKIEVENTERRFIWIKKPPKQSTKTSIEDIPSEFPVLMPADDTLTLAELNHVLRHHRRHKPTLQKFFDTLPKFIQEGKIGQKIGILEISSRMDKTLSNWPSAAQPWKLEMLRSMSLRCSTPNYNS